MDIFSSIRNIQNNSYDKHFENVNKNENLNNRKIEDIQKDMMEKKSKEEIKAELQHIVKELNEAMNPLNTDLEFKYNNKVEELTVMVIDKKTDKIIREFPPKEALQLMEKMRELVGMLFDKKG